MGPIGWTEATGEAAGPQPAQLAALTAAQRDVLGVLRRLGVPATVDEIATAVGRHPNTTREHLDALRSTGRVTRLAVQPHGRGRPAYRYQAARAGDDTGGLYAGLVSVLAEELVRTSPDPVSSAVHAGRSWSHSLATGSDAASPSPMSAESARLHVVADLTALGFAPRSDARTTVVRLRACPVLESARKHPDVVCAVHRGLVEGLAERYGTDSQQVSLTPFAHPGWCRLGLGPGA